MGGGGGGRKGEGVHVCVYVAVITVDVLPPPPIFSPHIMPAGLAFIIGRYLPLSFLFRPSLLPRWAIPSQSGGTGVAWWASLPAFCFLSM